MRTRVPRHIWAITAAGVIVLFAFSSFRHWGIRSTAWDLGFFDQAVYLISRGVAPIGSFSNYHVLGDHASWILYPLALLYLITPDVHWLLAIQAIALAGAAIPFWLLMQHDHVPPRTATAAVVGYLLYPGIFSVNLLDFHPDVFVVPLLFLAVLYARRGQVAGFAACLVLITGCKEILALPMIALGAWLLVFETRSRPETLRPKLLLMGCLAVVAGVAWWLLSTKLVIPAFGGPDITRGRYAYLGQSASGILIGLLTKPGVVARHLFTSDNAQYLLPLLVPVGWALSVRHLSPLVGAIPTLLINLLSTEVLQKNVGMGLWYSLPAVPFLFIAGVSALASARPWRRHPALIVVWAIAGFAYWISIPSTLYAINRPERVDSRVGVKSALSLITTDGPVLTTNDIAPHLTHRPIVKLAVRGFDPASLKTFDYVLLNIRHPGLFSTPAFAKDLRDRLQKDADFCERFALNDVHLFVRVIGGCKALYRN